jgi:hypothetical protein
MNGVDVDVVLFQGRTVPQTALRHKSNDLPDFLTKKKRPIPGASARRKYLSGRYVLASSIINRFKSQVVIDTIK